MRLIFGLVLGAVLTVAGAYWHDHFYTAASPNPPARTLVNWDVAADLARNTSQLIRSQIARLTDR